MNRWWLSSLFAFSFGLVIGQKFFASLSRGQRSPTAVQSYLEIDKLKKRTQPEAAPKALSEQMTMSSEITSAATSGAVDAITTPETVSIAPTLDLEAKSGFLEKIRDVECCSGSKPSDLHLSKLDLALDQSCNTFEKSCLEQLWKDIVSIPDVDLMRASVERYMVRYSAHDPALVMGQAVELAAKDPFHIDAYAYANLLGIYYEQDSAAALKSFFDNEKVFGSRASEFAKIFITNEMASGSEVQAALISDLAPYAQTQELAVRMRKKIFSDWFDEDPEAAAQFAESQSQDTSILEILNLKRQISSYKTRLTARAPAGVSDQPEALAEVQAQMQQLLNGLLERTRL